MRTDAARRRVSRAGPYSPRWYGLVRRWSDYVPGCLPWLSTGRWRIPKRDATIALGFGWVSNVALGGCTNNRDVRQRATASPT